MFPHPDNPNETSFVFVPVTDASGSNRQPYTSLFSYLFGRGGRDVSRRSDQSQSTLGSEFLGRKKRAFNDASDNMVAR